MGTSCVVTATSAAQGNYTSGTATLTITVNAGAPTRSSDSVPDTLAFTSSSGSTDYPHHTTYTTPSATGTTGDTGTISYSLDSSSSTSCTVSGSSGAISAIGGTGTCVVDATQV